MAEKFESDMYWVGGSDIDPQAEIARAILAAEQRWAEREGEACAQVARDLADFGPSTDPDRIANAILGRKA